MKKKILAYYIASHLKTVEKNLSAFIKTKKPQYLHHLRVDVKKIRAICSFAEKVYKDEYDPEPLKLLFNKAGKIREAQINSNLLRLFPHPPGKLFAQLKKKENILTGQLIKNSSRYYLLIKKFRENVCLPGLLPGNKIIKKYFLKQEQKANKYFQNKNRDDLHQYRKRLKKIMYVYAAMPASIQKRIKINIENVHRQQQKIGSWHDTYSAINFISHVRFPKNTNEYTLKLKEKEEKLFNDLVRK